MGGRGASALRQLDLRHGWLTPGRPLSPQEPIIPDFLSLQMMTMDLFAFTQPDIPAECAAQYSGSEGWRCLWPSYRLPFVFTPYFLNAAQFDAFQIMCARQHQTHRTV